MDKIVTEKIKKIFEFLAYYAFIFSYFRLQSHLELIHTFLSFVIYLR